MIENIKENLFYKSKHPSAILQKYNWAQVGLASGIAACTMSRYHTQARNPGPKNIIRIIIALAAPKAVAYSMLHAYGHYPPDDDSTNAALDWDGYKAIIDAVDAYRKTVITFDHADNNAVSKADCLKCKAEIFKEAWFLNGEETIMFGVWLDEA